MKLETIETWNFSEAEVQQLLKEYKYQKDLGIKLKEVDGDFDQSIINEIVLWKVNRYASLDEQSLNLLNTVSKNECIIDSKKTTLILQSLLETGGIQIAMASTILRFKNPTIYQILDQRVYRFIYGELLNDRLKRDKENVVEVYLEYLKKLREICVKHSVPFEESDVVFYELDKKFNKGIKLKY